MTDLLPGVDGEDGRKADIIYTATILGFCAIHAELGHKFAFEGEAWNTRMSTNDAELVAYQEFLNILSAISEVLDAKVGSGIGDAVQDGTSPTLDHHNVMICGWPGGHAMQPHTRVFVGDRLDDPHLTKPSGPKRNQAIMGTIGSRVTAEVSEDLGFVGPGAYTGAVMERDGESIFSSTTQCIEAVNPTHRWTPDHRGIIKGAHEKARPEGFGAAPAGDSRKPVGYSHGMNYAMRDALATSPTAVPIEIASGKKTTKLASCFGCTTYMWACGFPPSATHLGSALSWHPLKASLEKDAKKQAIVESMNTRYHLQVHGYLLRGADILSKLSVSGRLYKVGRDVATIAKRLKKLQEARDATAHEVGANYFLDACMDHKNDKVRLKNILLTE
jgi:hypothetical protein